MSDWVLNTALTVMVLLNIIVNKIIYSPILSIASTIITLDAHSSTYSKKKKKKKGKRKKMVKLRYLFG